MQSSQISNRTYSDKQREVLQSANKRWNILSGAVRSGKTFVSYDLIPLRLHESTKGNRLLVGKTERTLERNVLDPMRERFPGCVGRIRNPGVVNIFGKPFYIAGANDDRSVTKIQGLGLVYAYGDEITTWPESFFQMLKSRLDAPGAKFDGTCNPEGPYHWFKKDFLDLNNKNLYHATFRLDDNPYLPSDFVEALKSEYTGVWYERMIEGRWVIAQGLIYDMFAKDVHIVPTKDRPYIEYYVACDYGTQNPTHFGLWGKSDKWYKVAEYHHEGRDGQQKTDGQYADELDAFIKDVDIKGIVIDPSAASFREELRQRGYHVIPAKNDVLDGIRNVGSALQRNTIAYNECCVNTIREYAGYSWDPKAAQRGEDKPMKENDHAMDADRYFINTILHGMKKLKAIKGLY